MFYINRGSKVKKKLFDQKEYKIKYWKKNRKKILNREKERRRLNQARHKTKYINLKNLYIENYEKDLESHIDKFDGFGYKSKIRLFCSDCAKYYNQGKDKNNKFVRIKNGCKGNDLEWEICIYKKMVLEVINK